MKLSALGQYKKVSRTADWILAFASIPFAAYMLWSTWPAAGLWTLLAIAMVPVSFVLAYFDWQTWFEKKARLFLLKRSMG